MKCPTAETLAAYHHGVLDPPARAKARDHLVGCAACRREIEEMDRLDLEMPDAGPDGAIAEAGPDRNGIPSALWAGVETIRTRPAVTLRVTIGTAGGCVEVIGPLSGPGFGADAERVSRRAAVRASAPVDRSPSGERSAFRFSRDDLAGTVIVRPGAIRVFVSLSGRPAAGAPVTLSGPGTSSVGRTGEDGTARFEAARPGRYLLRLYSAD